jgi:hypothetical protein
MKQYLFSRLNLSVGAALAALVALPAQAVASVDTSMCDANPLLTQPFLSAGDSNWYTLMPGESPGSFDGRGWTLTGGASIKTTTTASGPSTVLDLPSGSKAISPVVCVTSSYPVARAMVRNVVGSEGVFFYVSYDGTSTWNTPKNTGQVHGAGTAWTPVTPVNLQPYNVSGWEPVKKGWLPR